MKVIRSVRLWLKENTSDKIYEVDLVDLETSPGGERHLVNFRYGRRGGTLREGTKTTSPVALAVAEKLFDSVVISKVNGGYRRMGEAAASSPEGLPAAAETGGREAELLQRLAACLRSPWPPADRDRLFWRIGVVRLAAAFPPLAAMAGKLGASEASYSLVHALAHCGGGAAADILAEIAAVNVSAVTRDYAAYALASDLMGARRRPPLLALPQAGDPAQAGRIEAAIEGGDGPALLAALEAAAVAEPGFAGRFLVALAHHAWMRPASRPALLGALDAAAARPPYVQVLRRLFKYADLTDDGPLFAATARRFELARPMYRSANVYRDRVHVEGLRQPLKLSEEQASPTPRIALSDQTLLYFKRRAWRTLRKRAELGQGAFADMATALLLAFTDADGEAPRRWNGYARVDGRFVSIERSSGIFRRVWSVGHLLHGRAPTTRFNALALTHMHEGSPQPAQRGEAFPELWDTRPDLLLRIAAEARNRPAAVFAVRALEQGAGPRSGARRGRLWRAAVVSLRGGTGLCPGDRPRADRGRACRRPAGRAAARRPVGGDAQPRRPGDRRAAGLALGRRRAGARRADQRPRRDARACPRLAAGTAAGPRRQGGAGAGVRRLAREPAGGAGGDADRRPERRADAAAVALAPA